MQIIVTMKTLVLLLVPVFMISVGSVYAQENTTDRIPKFFAIQHAQSGSLSEINETAYSLELNDFQTRQYCFQIDQTGLLCL